MSHPAEISQERSRALTLYSLLMEEVKIRVLAINRAVGGQLVMPGWMVREFCYLQLRMICELVALGCLVAHGDIKATKTGRLPKEYAADRILMLLGELYADFYPTPLRYVSAKPHPDGNRPIRHFEPVTTGFLTKADLLALYRKSGQFLHRGAMRKLLSPEPITEGFPDVVKWVKKFQALLSTHTLCLFDESQFVCTMVDPRNGRVHVALSTPPIPQ